MTKRATAICVSGTAVAGVLLSGCSGSDAEDGQNAGAVQTQAGVTDSEIHLGVLTDMSGPFRQSGLAQTHGNQLWADAVNAAGGICERDVVLEIQDAGHDPEHALPLYTTMEPSNLGLLQLSGWPVLAALRERLTDDQMLAATGAGASSHLDSPSLLPVGATYDVELLNLLAWAQDEGLIAPGDTLGHVYVDSDYGHNALLGSQTFAETHDLQLVGVPVAVTDTDLGAVVASLTDAGATAVVLSTAPDATGAAALASAGQGLDVPLLASSPAWSPSLLTDQATAAALGNLHIAASTNTFGGDDPRVAELLEAYNAKGFAEMPSDAVLLGYGQGLAWQAVLEQACAARDLTRAGVLQARSQLAEVDTAQLLAGPLDLSVPGGPSQRTTHIARADPAALSGVVLVELSYESADAAQYTTPFQE